MSGISILVLNKNQITKVWVYRGLFPFVWLLAARVNSLCNGMKKIALEMRVFGYKGTSQLDLDSFLLFVDHAHLRAKLFHVPILPAYLIAVIVLASFILLILFQTSTLTIHPTNLNDLKKSGMN
ncbi:hypothetical protein KUTeg_008989 [Tegillarca granosa]|uniref:Uncharacterized protein n=1 Tax=Tegillarca granosa TaxID=220873 RepID=A0ABQ9FB52_TEGGR|nr:hypothetical protein KUTeg_008989 [Tegillarca granosa]